MRLFLTGEEVSDIGQHFCPSLERLYIGPLMQGEDRSPANLAVLTCAMWPGNPPRKLVFLNLEDLQIHCAIGHRVHTLRELYGTQFPNCSFPVTCRNCVDWKGCGQTLISCKQVILHLGLIHQRLFYILLHDQDQNLSHIIQHLFPE